MAIIAVIFIAMLLVEVVRRRRRRKITDSATPPVFKVVSLGTQGTGKTVFLASMFEELQIAQSGRSYSFRTDFGDQNYLAGIYKQVIDTTQSWPRGTEIGATKDFRFDCIARHDGDQHHVLSLSYLDYAGELLQGGVHDPEALATLHGHITTAHALFGMIDGRRLMQFLQGEAAGHTYIEGDLVSMLGLLAHATCPIHLIITKWDLVTDIGEEYNDDEARLAIVRSALHNHDRIGSLIRQNPSSDRVMRLIPVSAVGSSFAKLDGGGQVTKVKGAVARGKNLDLPFAAVVPDYLSQLAAQINEADRAKIGGWVSDRNAGASSGDATTVVRTLQAATIAALNRGLAASVSGQMLRPFVDVFFEYVALNSSGAAAGNAEEAATARAGLLDDFKKAIWRLETETPSSVL